MHNRDHRILVADQIASESITRLQSFAEVAIRTDITPEELIGEIHAYDTLVVRSRT